MTACFPVFCVCAREERLELTSIGSVILTMMWRTANPSTSSPAWMLLLSTTQSLKDITSGSTWSHISYALFCNSAFLQLHLLFLSSRFAKYYQSEDGTEYRTLHKAFAIRFEIIVSGNVGRLCSDIRYIKQLMWHIWAFVCLTLRIYLQAGKFNAVPFLINLVTAFTSVGLVRYAKINAGKKHTEAHISDCCIFLQATVLCDIILLNFHKGADEYKAKKFEEVPDCLSDLFTYISMHRSSRAMSYLSVLFMTGVRHCVRIKEQYTLPGKPGVNQSIGEDHKWLRDLFYWTTGVSHVVRQTPEPFK